MKNSINFDGNKIAPNTKFQGFIPIQGTDVRVPVTVINGIDDGKTVTVTSGIHSGEYVGIQCALELAQEIQPEDVKGSIIFVHPCNPTGFFSHVSYVVPEDDKNLGRQFPGDKQGTLSEKIAASIVETCIENCDFELDLHGGDLHERLSTFVFAPKEGPEEALNISHEVAKYMDVKYVVLTNSGLTKLCLGRGIPSLVLERGDRGLWNKYEVTKYKLDVLNVLKYFKIIPGEVNYHGPEQYYFDEVTMDYSPVDGCWYRFVELEEQVVKGQILGEVRDFHGNILHKVEAKYDGVIHSYWSALAIKSGHLMVGYGS